MRRLKKQVSSMGLLRTHSPDMVEKEILMHMISYNAIRLLMLKAGQLHDVNHRRISFKGVIQVLQETLGMFLGLARHPQLLQIERDNLWARIAERIVPKRPGRSEPRKKNRRPKTYGWLCHPRHTYFGHFRNEAPPREILDHLP